MENFAGGDFIYLVVEIGGGLRVTIWTVFKAKKNIL